jgi:3-phosphoshikimate 1-carboxyvinyltransferase
MVTVTITGATMLRGTLRVPGDKSISHRAIMLAALADGTSTITGLSDGADVRNTLAAVRALGAVVAEDDAGGVRVTGGRLHASDEPIDVGNSGTGIRLLAGIAAGLDFSTRLTGDTSIQRRPMDRVTTPLRLMGAQIDGRDDGRFAPLTIRGGGLHGIDYRIPIASAQVKSAILLAGLAASGTTTLTEPAVSRRHTEEMLADRGADVTVDGTTVSIRASQLRPRDQTVPGDPSQAAFWLATAAALPGSDVTVEAVYVGPARTGFLDVLRRMGAQLEIAPGPAAASTVRVVGADLHGTEITPAEIPGLVDEIPALAVTAALADGVTRIRGALELRVKESDRLTTIAEMLNGFGVPVVEHDDGLTITGGGRMRPAVVRSHGDHRIAMAAAMAAIATTGSSRIEGFDAVETSYRSFLADLETCAPGVLADA